LKNGIPALVLTTVATLIALTAFGQQASCIVLTALPNWYQGDYPAGTATVRLQLQFQNTSGPMNFVGTSFQLWAVPSGNEPPVTVNAQPAGGYPGGATFEYDLAVDVSGLPATDTGLAFRPMDQNFGTMSPGTATLIGQDASCTALVEPGVPALGSAGIAALVSAMAVAGLLLLRRIG
jgi:hypothetical protein